MVEKTTHFAKLHLVKKVETNTHCIIVIAFISCQNGQNIHTVQYSSINNVIFNSKSSNKGTIRFTV